MLHQRTHQSCTRNIIFQFHSLRCHMLLIKQVMFHVNLYFLGNSSGPTLIAAVPVLRVMISRLETRTVSWPRTWADPWPRAGIPGRRDCTGQTPGEVSSTSPGWPELEVRESWCTLVMATMCSHWQWTLTMCTGVTEQATLSGESPSMGQIRA